MFRFARIGGAAFVVLNFLWFTTAANADAGVRVRLMLHPYVVAPGELPPSALATLSQVAGVELLPAGATRTGALEFLLANPLDDAALGASLRKLRHDRSVVWAEAVTSGSPKAVTKSTPALTGRKLMVRMNGSEVPDWATVLPRWTEMVGSPVTVQRQIGQVWVLQV